MKDRYYLPLLLLVCCDFLVVSSSFLLAYWLRFYSMLVEWIPPRGGQIHDLAYYTPVALILGILAILIFERTGLYERRVGLDRQVWPGLLILATVILYVFIMAILFNYRGFEYSRPTVAMAVPISAVNLILLHVLLKKVQIFLIDKGIVFMKTILVGPMGRCQEVLVKLQEHHGSQYQVLGFLTTEENSSTLAALPCLGSDVDLVSALETGNIDQVIIAMPTQDPRRIMRVIQTCRQQKVACHLIPDLYDYLCRQMTLEDFEGLPTLMLGESPLDGFGFFLKRSMDVIISGTALVISSPIMLLVALLIKIDSNGPIFYVQERVGSDGRKFFIYKFRSMIDQAEKDTGPKWATANDPRTTRIGRFLRRYNLDELPQFVNVFRGEMSLVGPRPERPFFVNKFKEEIPLYMRRHMVKAGITGLAQVSGWRGDTSVTERTHYDLYYVQNWSLLLDLKIILRTLISFKNAY